MLSTCCRSSFLVRDCVSVIVFVCHYQVSSARQRDAAVLAELDRRRCVEEEATEGIRACEDADTHYAAKVKAVDAATADKATKVRLPTLTQHVW